MGRHPFRPPCTVAAAILSMPENTADHEDTFRVSRPCGPRERLLANATAGSILIWNLAFVNLVRNPDHLWVKWPLIIWLLLLTLHVLLYATRRERAGSVPPPQAVTRYRPGTT